jgi:hypothetical protein
MTLGGWFDPARNETRDANGRPVGRGDLLSRLFLVLAPQDNNLF